MRKLDFEGDFTIDHIFKNYRYEIYNNVLTAIKESYNKSEINEVNVVQITTRTKGFTINLPRDRFISGLDRCISFFEELEEYEKCQECVNLKREINNKINN